MTREIDARVAREVMGWDSWRPGLPFSTSMDAAMEVVERMRSMGHKDFGWKGTHNGSHLYQAWFGNWMALADTPALAICLAALEAVKSDR